MLADQPANVTCKPSKSVAGRREGARHRRGMVGGKGRTRGKRRNRYLICWRCDWPAGQDCGQKSHVTLSKKAGGVGGARDQVGI